MRASGEMLISVRNAVKSSASNEMGSREEQ